MLLGSERLIASQRLNGLRVGVLANPASVDHGFGHVVGRLGASSAWRLAAIFGPQHGFRSNLQDNMIETPHGKDPRRDVPIFSLYSETREPTPEMLDLIDVLVIDLQDVGARIYTFIYTMANCLRAAARAGRAVPGAGGHSPGRLQGAHPRWRGGHRGADPCRHRLDGWRPDLVHDGQRHEHHRGVGLGAGRLPRVRHLEIRLRAPAPGRAPFHHGPEPGCRDATGGSRRHSDPTEVTR